MIATTWLYILIWMFLTLIQGHRSAMESKNCCANYLTKFSVDMNGIWYTVQTCWCHEPHTHFISSILILLLYSQLISGVYHLWWDFCICDCFSNPTTEVVTFLLHGWCVLGVLLLPAFDKVWREGLLLKILESGISGRMYWWIRCFLHDISARIKLDGHMSKSVKMQEGVPHGGVISPTLFLLCINNIMTVLPQHVSNILHVDDLAVWSASEYTTTSAYRIQEAVNKVEQWTNDWGLQISEVKTQATVISLFTSKEKVAIKLGDKILPQVETFTFLGVRLDNCLSWKAHIENMETKGIKMLAVIKKIV